MRRHDRHAALSVLLLTAAAGAALLHRSAEVTWPSGKRRALGEVKADRVLRVEEPR